MSKWTNATDHYIGKVINGYEVIGLFGTSHYQVKSVETGNEFTVSPIQLRDNTIVDSFARVHTAHPHLMSLWS